MELCNLWITAAEYSYRVTIPENTTFHITIIKFITVSVFYVCLLSNVKYKVLLVFTAHDVMKTHTWVEAQLHAFSTFTTRWRLVDKFYAPAILFPAKFSVNTHCIGGWLILKTCVNSVQNGKVPCLLSATKPQIFRYHTHTTINYPVTKYTLLRNYPTHASVQTTCLYVLYYANMMAGIC